MISFVTLFLRCRIDLAVWSLFISTWIFFSSSVKNFIWWGWDWFLKIAFSNSHFPQHYISGLWIWAIFFHFLVSSVSWTFHCRGLLPHGYLNCFGLCLSVFLACMHVKHMCAWCPRSKEGTGILWNSFWSTMEVLETGPGFCKSNTCS